MKTAVAIRHVHFEDLGTLEAVLAGAGYKLLYHDVGVVDLSAIDPLRPDLLVVLGGPVGVYDADAYPFLDLEKDMLAMRLAAGRPTFGICLGAQLIAAALGARVAPTSLKEIGFSELALTAAGSAGPLRHLEGTAVLHWHGDAFAIPDGASHLAATAACANQAFALGPNVLALQFHAEAQACTGLERWLIGHAAELAASGIDPRTIRADAARFGPALRKAARAMFTEWLEGLDA
ncbi:GMP synthase [Mesorhizobium sp. L-8-10]|uniref:glutamine amidotransferase n=1 Tax=unclassified Mesorhizobium TaxID=325217 RepID=UPI0019262E45|nr:MULTISPECIES: glutamine amidotransferase [unclassified Mesorhizobium]BCH21733.1 GMP synthase [Mesorhizobium sp. L-8-3]BCH29420.1 GMP synthase [Mesorhizobium sp. L-8-10]